MSKPIPQHAVGIDRLLAVVHDLRSPGGCPWDQKQTHASLATHLIEEAYETVECLQTGDMDHLKEELGDILLQVVMHSELAGETKHFDFDAVAHTVAQKLVRRHPHVYGAAVAATPGAVLQSWAEIKKGERKAAGKPDLEEGGYLADVPLTMPALVRAYKLQKKAAKVGFDWPDPSGMIAKIHEETDEIAAELQKGDAKALGEEIGDLLFSVVNLARWAGHDPEVLLSATNGKFTRRFHSMESRLREELSRKPAECSLEEMDAAWDAVKAEESV